MTASDKPVFSNMVEHISGLVTAGNIMGYNDPNLTEADLRTDLYRPVNNINKLRSLLLQALFEYNKENPKIKIALYRVSDNLFSIFLILIVELFMFMHE